MAHTFDTKLRGTGTANPQTLAYTCGANATLLVLSIVYDDSSSRIGGAPTYNSVTMTQVGTTQNFTSKYAEMWYLADPDTSSACNISIPNTDGTELFFIVSSYIAQSGYTSTLDVSNESGASGSNPALSVTPTINGDVIVDTLIDGNLNIPTANNQILLYSTDNGSYSDNAQYALQSTAGAIEFTWTVNTSNFCMIVGAFKEILAGWQGSINGVSSISKVINVDVGNIAKINSI